MGILLRFLNFKTITNLTIVGVVGIYIYLSIRKITLQEQEIKILTSEIKECRYSLNFMNLYSAKNEENENKFKKVKKYVKDKQSNYIDFYNIAKRLQSKN